MPSNDGSAASAAARVSSTRCPRAPAGGLSDGASIKVRTPWKGSRLGCPATLGISIAMHSSSVFMRDLILNKEENSGTKPGTIRAGPRSDFSEAAHSSYLVDSKHSVAQQDFLDLCFFHLVASVQVTEDKLEVGPSQLLVNGVAAEVLRQQPCGWHDC